MYETLQHNLKRLNEKMHNILRLFGGSGGGPGGWDLLGYDWILSFILQVLEMFVKHKQSLRR